MLLYQKGGIAVPKLFNRSHKKTRPSKVVLPQLFTSLWINLRSSSKRETDVLEITTFLPASDSLFGSRLMLNNVIWCGVITFSISTRSQQRNLESENLEIHCVNNWRWEGGAALFGLVFLVTCVCEFVLGLTQKHAYIYHSGWPQDFR